MPSESPSTGGRGGGNFRSNPDALFLFGRKNNSFLLRGRVPRVSLPAPRRLHEGSGCCGVSGGGEAGRSQSGRADPRPPLDPSGRVGPTDVKPEQANLLSHIAPRSAKTLRAGGRAGRRAGRRPAPGPKALTVSGNTTRGKQTLTLPGPIPAGTPRGGPICI